MQDLTVVGVMEEEYTFQGIEMDSNNFGPRFFDSQEHWNQKNTFATFTFNTVYTYPLPLCSRLKKTEED